MSRVTDEMLKRAVTAFCGVELSERDSTYPAMRRALEAALAEPADEELERWVEVLSAGLRAYYTSIGVETDGHQFRNLCRGFLRLLFDEWRERAPKELARSVIAELATPHADRTQATWNGLRAGFAALATRLRGDKP